MNQKYTELLKEYISFQSISTDEKFKEGINKTANWLKELFEKNNFETKIIEGYDNPIVFAKYTVDENLPTCLIYGHYDVQPASFEDGWKFDPFKLREENGKYFARGVIDNKGQNLIHIVSILELIEAGNLKYNIKFVLEGNEETGSPKLDIFVQENKEDLKSDFFLISDGEFTMGHPAIDVSYRGIVNLTLKVKTSTHDLHSGSYGGAVPNAAFELSDILSSCKDEKGKFVIPGIQNNNSEIDKDVLEKNKNIPYTTEEYKKVTGTKEVFEEKDIDIFSKVGLLTSMEITGLKSGYIEKGYKNAIPSTAEAKINFRLNPEMEPEYLSSCFIKYVNEVKKDYVDVEVQVDEEVKGIMIDFDNQYVKDAVNKLEEVFRKTVLYINCGAIIPIVKVFSNELNIPAVQVPIGNEDCNMHAVDENYDMEIIEKGLEFSKKFFGK